jgi:hypothetical protein
VDDIKGMSLLVAYMDECEAFIPFPKEPRIPAEMPRPSTTPPMWAHNPQKSKRDRRAQRRVK